MLINNRLQLWDSNPLWVAENLKSLVHWAMESKKKENGKKEKGNKRKGDMEEIYTERKKKEVKVYVQRGEYEIRQRNA
jgi:hypothetical protein